MKSFLRLENFGLSLNSANKTLRNFRSIYMLPFVGLVVGQFRTVLLSATSNGGRDFNKSQNFSVVNNTFQQILSPVVPNYISFVLFN